jgi:hypothetical protein
MVPLLRFDCGMGCWRGEIDGAVVVLKAFGVGEAETGV